MCEMIRVGMADYKICQPPNCLTTLGLGSCLGIVLYDKNNKISGLAHIMLPDSMKIKHMNENRAKFADTCIVDLLDELIDLGAHRESVVAKIAGGAQMFAFVTENDLLRIGDQNIKATKEILEQLHIPIISEDVGLSYGRTIEFYPETSELLIKVIGKEIKVI